MFYAHRLGAGSHTTIARLEESLAQLSSDYDEAVRSCRRMKYECERLRTERDEALHARREAEDERDNAVEALQAEHAKASSPPIRHSCLKQRVIETANKLKPQW